MYRVGIDLGGTNIVAAVIDEEYHIVASEKCPASLPRSAAAIMDDMALLTRKAVEKAGLTLDQIGFVGIGSPGTCNKDTGVVEYANNLGFENVPMVDEMKKRLDGKPVGIENDANAAAFGEYIAGAGRGSASCVCITLGTGVGGGIIDSGKIYTGFNFAGAELGHTVIVKDGEPCSCGRNGCWEAYASATALIRQTRCAMKAHPDSAMWKVVSSLDDVDGKTAFDGMRMSDAVSTEVVDRYIDYIACGLTNMINIFQPEIICIGGGICKEGDRLIKPLMKYIERERYSRFSNRQTKLVTAALGNDAGLIGAAFLDQSV